MAKTRQQRRKERLEQAQDDEREKKHKQQQQETQAKGKRPRSVFLGVYIPPYRGRQVPLHKATEAAREPAQANPRNPPAPSPPPPAPSPPPRSPTPPALADTADELGEDNARAPSPPNDAEPAWAGEVEREEAGQAAEEEEETPSIKEEESSANLTTSSDDDACPRLQSYRASAPTPTHARKRKDGTVVKVEGGDECPQEMVPLHRAGAGEGEEEATVKREEDGVGIKQEEDHPATAPSDRDRSFEEAEREGRKLARRTWFHLTPDAPLAHRKTAVWALIAEMEEMEEKGEAAGAEAELLILLEEWKVAQAASG